MPVTVHPASHPARKWRSPKPADSAHALFQAACPDDARRCQRLIQSSFTDLTAEANVVPYKNGLVHAVLEAYSHHHHLSIRPEDVWFAVLSQLSFYVNAHAEELRAVFVAHEGQKEVTVVDVGSVDTVDFGKLAVALTREMDKSLVDSSLRAWMLPDFSTTTPTDTVVAAVLMMGALQAYFRYSVTLLCGIPSVTLLGDRADWLALRRRLDKLSDFGAEPAHFARLLIPVLDNFVRSFDDDAKDDPSLADFWSRIAHHQRNGSGPSYLSGWITAFCFWNAKGETLYHRPRTPSGDPSARGAAGGVETRCELAGEIYHRVDTSDIPAAYASVPVRVDDNGREVRTRMVAGSVGVAASSSGDKLDVSRSHAQWIRRGFAPAELTPVTPDVRDDVTGLDSLRPVSGWFLYQVQGEN
ncbi:hypothetical protein F4780DRAFT_612180 [Xylariomycetidae sp. FL0641]|nr:hypothetical protein F4780DRAFT_612180 [Xylariomycetidae sp. FL0641]